VRRTERMTIDHGQKNTYWPHPYLIHQIIPREGCHVPTTFATAVILVTDTEEQIGINESLLTWSCEGTTKCSKVP